MFSVRLVTADSYQATPLPQLDPTYSEFRGTEIKYVPIVRVFGTTPTGEKTCLHLHGVFPYMYIPFTGEDNADAYAYRLAASLDAAINISLGSATSNTQHVYQVQRVAGIPYYGYHRREHQFFKVSFYNPAMMKKATDLLQNGAVMNHRLQTHEAHIPYILQFMIDYNLHGMSLINLSSVKHRRVTQLFSETKPSNDSIISPIENVDYLPPSVVRQSVCELEVDALVTDIVNRQELEKGMELNPGLAAIWEEERARRAQSGLPSDNSQLINPPSPTRPVHQATNSDIYQQQRLNRRLQLISQCDESSLSTNSTPTSYPLEVNDDDQLINASNLRSNSRNNLDISQQQSSDVTSLTPLNASQGSKNSQSTYNRSNIDADDLPLLEMLMEMARDSGNQESVDDDSVLGTQLSIFDNDGNKSGNEDEEDVADLNLTCLELDSMSPWDNNIEKSPSQLVPVNNIEVNAAVPHRDLGDIFVQDTDEESQDSEGSRLPQLDGAGDLSSFIESEEDESVKRCQELKRVSECQKPILNNNLSNSDDEAFIIEEIISGLSKSNKNGNFSLGFTSDGKWPSYLPNETDLEQFDTMNYERLGSEFESDFDHAMAMSLLLTNNDETSIGINLSVENEEIPLEAVLTGDPCFTQTAEMDKSDFTELKDQYVSLLDSALVPDVYKNSYDSDIVNSNCNQLEGKEMVSLNSRSFRTTSNSRNSNLSSENVTPNIQEPDAKVCKNKLSLPSTFERIDENCKDFSSRLPSDSSDYNCNVVATWEELQDPKFIPKRILKKKRIRKAREKVLKRCPISSNSMGARRKGRKGLTNVTSHIVQENIIHILDSSSSNTSVNNVPLKIDRKTEEGTPSERLILEDLSSTAVDEIEKIPRGLSTKKSSSDNLSYDDTSNIIDQASVRISPTNLDSGLKVNILHEISSCDSVSDVRNTLPGVQYSTYLVSENENFVKPIIADFEELIDVPLENKMSLDNKPQQYISYYSSTRSHSGIPFGKSNHRHCYSFVRMGLIKNYVFAADEIWVIEKRKRSKQRASPRMCNKDCRLPIVLLEKLELAKPTELNTKQLSISEMGPENLNLIHDSSKIDSVNDNYIDNASLLHELFQSKSLENIDEKNTSQVSNYNEKLIDIMPSNEKYNSQHHEIQIKNKNSTQTICESDIKNNDNIICDKKQLPINDFIFTQSAQITSTQNYDQVIENMNNGQMIIKRVFDDESYSGKIGRKKRSILLKLGNRNSTDINPNGCSSNILSLSIREKNNDDNAPVNMSEKCIQPKSIKKKREKRKKKCENTSVMTIMKPNDTEKLCREKNDSTILTSFTMDNNMPPLCSQIINNIDKYETKIPNIKFMLNKESNIISSSHSESAILSKRPEIWCSIDRSKIDLSFIGMENSGKNKVKNIVNTSEFFDNIQKTTIECLKQNGNQILENNIDVNIVSKNDIDTGSHEQQFGEFNDTTLDVDLCDSLYKDDVTSNNIFDTAETIEEHAISTATCENVHESEQYTNAVAEANFYAGKKYTIDAISLEIPQCLFEEDSNSESAQKKLGDLLNDNGLHAQSTEEVSMSETMPDKLISDNCDRVKTHTFDLEQVHENNSDVSSVIDNLSSGNVILNETSTLNDIQKPLIIHRSSGVSELINGNELSNGCNYSRARSKSSSPRQLRCPSIRYGSAEYFDEEMIVKMMETALVLRENKTPNDSFNLNASLTNKEKIVHCSGNDLIKSTCNNNDSNINNTDKNTGTVSKYSPNKVSIIRRIYLSKNKNVHKESNDVNKTISENITLNSRENKFGDNRINNSEVKNLFEEKKNNLELSDKVVAEVSVEDVETSVGENCVSVNENPLTENNKNNISLPDVQSEDPDVVVISSESSDKFELINESTHESNNNEVICPLELPTNKDDAVQNSVVQNQDFKEDKTIEEVQDCNLSKENINSTDEPLDNSSESVLAGAAHDNDHNDISQVVELSKTNQYLKTDAIIDAVANSARSTADTDLNLDENEVENCQTSKNLDVLPDMNLKLDSTESEFHTEIIGNTCDSNIECTPDKVEKIQSNIPSKSTIDILDSKNHSISLSICREVSIVLERLELNGLNKYLKNNQNAVVASDKDPSKNMTLDKEKNKDKKSKRKKKCVRFNEQVFIFESDECAPLIDVEDQVEQMIEEENEIENSSMEEDNVTEISEDSEDEQNKQSIEQSSHEFVDKEESLLVSKNAIIDCDEVIHNEIVNDENTELMDNKVIEEINKNEEIFVADIDCPEVTIETCEQLNDVSLKDSVDKCKSIELDISEKNEMISTENREVSHKSQMMNTLIYKDEECNSLVAVNQRENAQIKKFDRQSKEIEIESPTVLEQCDKSLNENDVNCPSKKQLSTEGENQIKNTTPIDEINEPQSVEDKLPRVIERKTKTICSNGTSVKTINEPNNKRKRNSLSATQTQSTNNNQTKDNSFVGDVTNQYDCFKDTDRILRSYRTSSGYRNKVHTVSIDQKMVFTKVTISDQQLSKKSIKERFLGHIGLCSMKPRGYGWLPEHTMTGSIQLQQPHVVLQRLTPSVLKYYGYTRRFKSNKLGKRFKTSVNKNTFSIPAYDGPADFSSSDSETDTTVIDSEKRVCVYRSNKKKTEREAIVTPQKRKQPHSDEDEESNKRKHIKHCTAKPNITPLKMSYCSPQRKSVARSPGVSRNYTPLKITVTSPKIRKIVHNESDELLNENTSVNVNIDTTCATPKRRRRLICDSLFRNRIKTSSTDRREGSVCESEMNVEQQLMGELNIINTSVIVPDTQSSVALSYHESQSQDVSPSVKDAMDIRKNLFFSKDNLPVGVSSSECNAEIKQKDDCIKNINLNYDIAIPSTSGYNNFKVGNAKRQSESEDDDDDDDTIVLSEQSSNEINQNPPSIHSEELNNDSEDDLCNITFTQYLNSHELTQQQQISSNNQSQLLFKSKKPITIISKFNPPTIKQICDTMEIYNIPKFINLEPFFSNQADAPGQKELAHKMLNVPGKGVTDLSAFKSVVENITGINRWRRMKINEFHPTPGAFKSTSIRQSLAGHASVVIAPILSPPSPKNVRKWLRARDYLKNKKLKEENEAIVEVKLKEEKNNNSDIVLQNECSNDSDSVVERSPEQIVMPKSSKLKQRLRRRKTDELKVQEFTDNSIKMSKSSSSSGDTATSLKSILAKSSLFKSIEQPKQLGISLGQIECLTNTIRTNIDNENMQKCKALTRYQFITIFCVEVHVNTRDDLLPDPQHDSISALFYAIQNDIPPTSTIKALEHGIIAICGEGESKSSYCYGSNLPFNITFVADEKNLFETFINIVKRSDAEIFIGWEIESLSWGYIFQRALHLGIKFIEGISRVPTSLYKSDNQISNDLHSLADTKLPGRIVLDIWRIMKSEIALLTYTFENVIYHVMNERLPCPSFKSLTKWWQLTQSRWKVVQHYSTKILGILRILEQLDIIGRTSEYARLFGIQFYEVFSRGSQFRVESIMLRLAKPLNYIALSPSGQQRSSMRAMEALPLIMEPESMFYSDPVVVLDFQSLYPSIIIAHNYCFSTCLGRVEHIGQPDPFEFGAYVLRVPKHTALKMQGKVNFSPCGVAFVKREVRQGILPRMLTEILNTRLMVKKAMKDHSKDDKLLQRVLHSRQKGLKDLANVTYGYTAANFTGRMPCIEVGDSVISKAKETLERAIKMVESTPKWGARVIYGDTDSLFILIPGKSKDDAFKIGHEIADAVTASNPTPIKLKFEKILYPTILQTKKRYCGYMYETPDQKEPVYLAKGIETVRRDGCPAVSKILEKSLRILFDTKDVSFVKQYVVKQLDKVLSGKVSLEDLTFAKEFRGLKGYKERACVPALELTRRLMKKDPRAIPRRSERVRYIIVAGAPNEPLIHCVRSPWELIDNPGLRPNGIYYVTRVIIPPLNRCFNLMGVDVNTWYKEMPRRQTFDNPVAIPDNKQKQTIFQYFGTIVCVSCGRTSNKGICSDCLAHPTDTLIMLHERLRWLERINNHAMMICQSCVGRGDVADCVSLDCPVLYRRAQAQRDLTHESELRRIIEEGDKLEF